MKITVKSDRVFPSLKINAKTGDVVNTHPEDAAQAPKFDAETPLVLTDEDVVVLKKSKKVEVHNDGTSKE